MSMNVIHLGSGAGHRQWVEAVGRYPGAGNITLAPGEALSSVSADVAVVSGNGATDWATQALQANLAVVMDEVGAVDGTAFRAFQVAAKGKGSTVLWPRRYRYARCENLLKRLIGSGRLGGIGHVSCIDEAVSRGEGDGQSWHVSARAFAHFQSLQRLFGASPRKIMARLGPEPGLQNSTEAFIEFENGLHVHYSGFSGAPSDAHQLWIEGAEASVRTDGSAVWWRKRGWRFFMPLKFGFAQDPRDPAEMRATLDALVAARAGAGGSPEDLSAVAIVAAAFESHRRHSAVSLSELRAH
jgi:hypothetical protein